jgi:KipI family sensor histidine kinase inhibitor
MSVMEVRPVGRDAVLVEVADSREAVELAGWAREHGLASEVVPGARSVLLDGLVDRDALPGLLRAWTPGEAEPGAEVVIAVTYDGPDLADVGEQWGCSAEEVAVRHQAVTFVSAFCGFAPGFAYLSGLESEVSRLATPRTRVPEGSVALAGTWCGVYPTASPGGWRIIGRTDAALWDVTRKPPALLVPGTRVRFVPA